MTDVSATTGPLAPPDLMSLEQYARTREEFRRRVLEHKRLRTIAVGPHATWCFEDRLTVQYQVQEMLRVERIFESGGIQGELDAYNPLIPDGTNLKATLLIEYPDAEERALALKRLRGIEDRCYLAVASERSYAIADEDLERANAEKTSAVHFLRLELSAEARGRFLAGDAVELGIDHPAYSHAIELATAAQSALAADLGA